MRIYTFCALAFSVFSNFCFSQVGIGTTTPEGVLDVYSSNSALVLPRNDDPDGADNIAGNEDDGVLVPVEGMIVYDKADKVIRFYDGTKWQVLTTPGNPTTSNDGVVKILSGDTTAEEKPHFTILSSSSADFTTDTYYQIVYETGLNFDSAPITSWPQNVVSPGESSIYDASSGAFFENNVTGQVHMWRVVMNYQKQGSSNYDAYVTVKMENNVTGAPLVTSMYAAATNGVLTFNFITVTSDESLDEGYTISLKCTNRINLTVDHLTRVSLFKN